MAGNARKLNGGTDCHSPYGLRNDIHKRNLDFYFINKKEVTNYV